MLEIIAPTDICLSNLRAGHFEQKPGYLTGDVSGRVRG